MESIIKDFFLENNKSGYKTNEKWLCDNQNELYTAIFINCNSKTISFKEKIWLYINNLIDIPKCPNCGNNVHFIGTLKKGYNKYCSVKCLNSSKEHINKIKNSTFIKHGVYSHNQLVSVKEKKKQTTFRNYGVDSPIKSPLIRGKIKNTIINLYGVDTAMKISHVVQQRKKLNFTGEESNIKRMLNRINDDTIKFIKHDEIGNNMTFYCKTCNNEFQINSNFLTSRLSRNIKICTNCNKNKSYTNILETVTKMLKNENIKFEINNRKILGGLEIDIYFPKHKFGVEINGLYWHSEIYKDKSYHLNKTEKCEEQNIQLFHFFEDEILFKADILISILKIKLELIDNSILAKNCEIREISDGTCEKFLINNHIDGNVSSKIKIGLLYANELVSIMCFNKNKNDNYEILRFCNKLNTAVIGEANMLLNYFIEAHHPKVITVFADRRCLKENFYEDLGFEFICNTEPDYWYVKAGKLIRDHHTKFSKNALIKEGFDINKTEHQIMSERGYLKIYDCGKKKFKINYVINLNNI